jgi:DNA polymerase V
MKTTAKNIRLKKINTNKNFEFFSVDAQSPLGLPLFDSPISAGFPSPADDYIDLSLDLNKQLIEHPSATFYVRVKGSSMKNAHIANGDILIVDRSLEARNNDIVLCVLNGEFTVKKLLMRNKEIYLIPENENFEPIKINETMDFQVWGVVSFVIHDAKSRKSKF